MRLAAGLTGPASVWGTAVLVVLASGCRATIAESEERALLVTPRWHDPTGEVELAATAAQLRALAAEEPPCEPLAEAVTLLEAGQPEAAFDLLSVAMDRAPREPRLPEARGTIEHAMRFLRAAEGDFERAVGLDPRRASAWMALGRTRLALHSPARAVEPLERALSLEGDDAELQVLLARAYRATGRVEDAVRHYVEAARVLRGHPSAELFVEVASLAASEPGDVLPDAAYSHAFQLLDAALALDPGCAEAWFVRGFLLECKGDEGEGEDEPAEAYRRALALDPSSLEAWTNLALLLARREGPAAAARAARAALALGPDGRRRQVLEELLEER